MLVPTVGTDVDVMSISSFPFSFLSNSVLPEPMGPRQTQLGKIGGKFAILCFFFIKQRNNESEGILNA